MVTSLQDVFQRDIITRDYYLAFDPPSGDPLIIEAEALTYARKILIKAELNNLI